MDKYLYLLINIGSIFVPFIASFYPKHPFYKKWKNYFKANLIVALFFILWDVFFTKIGVWGFNDRYLLGIRIYNIPLEEVLFFFCIPYSSVFVYFSLIYLIKTNSLKNSQQFITLFFAICLGFIGLIFWDRLYTSVTFLLTSLFLFYNYFEKTDFSKIYLSYIITLFFFFIVNGILTGSFIDEPVVWYNNRENLRIRIGTIPIEDMFYGFLMIATIIQLFERLNRMDRKKI